MKQEKEKSDKESDILGTAMLDYLDQRPYENIKTWTSIAGIDELPLPYLFRTFDEMPALEQKALEMSKGSVLDIGCGSGSHALWLQDKGLEVRAIDISPGAIEVCEKRGISDADVLNIWELEGQTYDTLLLLMNGMGICGKLERLSSLLTKLKTLLKPGGQILADSSDLIYMFEDENEMPFPSDHYYGEVQFRTEYKDQKSETFPWLYVDFPNLELHANQAGLESELVLEGDHFDYLARMTIPRSIKQATKQIPPISDQVNSNP
jgi:SAM-dependent methyltransferase